MSVIEKIIERAAKTPKRIVLAEGADVRMVKASARLASAEFIKKIYIVGNPDDIKSQAVSGGADIDDVVLVNPETDERKDDYANEFFELRKARGVTEEEAKKLMLNPLYYSAMMVRRGEADGAVAGSLSTTADVLRSALYIIKTSKKIPTLSSCFIMEIPGCDYGENGVILYADCAVVPDPSPKQLANIARSSAETFRKLIGAEPRVALLSFSTKGSAEHEKINIVRRALELIKEKEPDLLVDGEIQVDAAIIPAICQKKAPGSSIAGKANIFIFPDLNSGNIAYKLTERLANAPATGPIVQGLNKPMNDLSRGCSADDIYNVAAVTALLS